MAIWNPSEKCIFQFEGVVLQIEDERVVVKFYNPNIVVAFPRILFESEDLLVVGQPVYYEIYQRPSGLPYQCFRKRIDTKENPHKKEIIKILEGVGE